MLYAAVAATLIAAFQASRSWGSTAAFVFAALNTLVILVFPAGKMLGLIIAGTMLYLLRESKPESKPSDSSDG